MDYIDNDDMSKLSSAKEGIALIQSYKTMFLDEREKYLLSCGFTEEEADNLLDEYIHNNSASSTITRKQGYLAKTISKKKPKIF